MRIKIVAVIALWAGWGIVILAYPPPESMEAPGIAHVLFFVPLFFAVLFTTHLLGGQPRQSLLIALGLLTLALFQLYRMITLYSILALLAALISIELFFRRRPGRRRQPHLLRRFPR